ncbi:MAG: GntR family transcriptional regulator [Armatimonadota bacterium]|nr:GntR family transcriptional regulator [Armatimonadota bacterium]MDR7518288.1 GntR family transcriptional regulator [Armatimonadota bacterium]MDR7549938.1 GntR family transcriptional regulator [Armatimonadota bacterium]
MERWFADETDRTLAPILGAPPVRETVSAAAYRRLREAILRGEVAMGTRINELELAEAWHVSRTPIRDALRRLEAEGVVEAVPGRGVVVPRLQQRDADELYELREILESRAARRASERSTEDLGRTLNVLIKAFGTALKQGDLARMTAVDVEWHAAVAAASGSRRLERAIDTVRAQVHPIRTLVFRVKGRAARSLREMAKVTAAIRARDAGRAEAAMREHLASVRAELAEVFQALEA